MRVMTSTDSKTLRTAPGELVSFGVSKKSLARLTGLVDDGDAGYALLDEHVDDVHDGGVHVGRRQVVVGADLDLLERFPQHLRLLDVHGDELEEAVLGDDADDGGALRLVVDVDDGYAAGAGLEHLAACFVERSFGVDGDGFYGGDAEGSLDIWGG